MSWTSDKRPRARKPLQIYIHARHAHALGAHLRNSAAGDARMHVHAYARAWIHRAQLVCTTNIRNFVISKHRLRASR